MSATELAFDATGIEQLRPADLTPARGVGQRCAAIGAFGALVVIDAVARIGGFQCLHAIVRRCPRLGAPPRDPATVEAISTAVDRAASYYFKKAWCLQRSATATCLLRLAGADAEMVIGVEKMPFYAHAWVEIDGVVANDHPVVQQRYGVLERC